MLYRKVRYAQDQETPCFKYPMLHYPPIACTQRTHHGRFSSASLLCYANATVRHSSSSLIWMTCRGRLAGCSSRGGGGASGDGAPGDCASGDCASATRRASRGARLAARAAGFGLEGGSPRFARFSWLGLRGGGLRLRLGLGLGSRARLRGRLAGRR